MIIKQISIFMENTTGRLADVTALLAQAGINGRHFVKIGIPGLMCQFQLLNRARCLPLQDKNLCERTMLHRPLPQTGITRCA